MGVRKQHLVFGPGGSAAGAGGTWCEPFSPDSSSEAANAGSADSGGVAVTVECLSDGGFIVELYGVRYTVDGADLDAGGGMTATVDGRRVLQCS